MRHTSLLVVLCVLFILTACNVSNTPTGQPPTTPTTTADMDALTTELKATVVAGLPPTPTPSSEGTRVPAPPQGATVLPVDVSKSLWAVFAYAVQSNAPKEVNFVAMYTHKDGAWQELARMNLEQVGFVGQPSLKRMQIEPSRIWLELQSVVGAHSGVYDLLSFDGQVLRIEVLHFHSSPDAGKVEDLDGDGKLEVVLNDTENYVFCYACGLRFFEYKVLRWDGSKLVEVRLEPLPESAPDDLRRLTNQSVDEARAGLWKDAQATMQQALVLKPQDQTVMWDAALLRMHAEAFSQQAQKAAYPLLGNIFYGDYAAALNVMRPYTVAQIFDEKTPLVTGTIAENWRPALTKWITVTTTLATQARPDLASAYFLRGWALLLTDPNSPAALADIERAAQLDPKESLFSESLAYLRKK